MGSGKQPAAKLLLLLLIAAIAPFEANGSHFRYGNINWEPKASNKVAIYFTTGWRNYIGASSTGATFRPGTLYYGDGSSTRPTFTVTSLSTSDNWIVGPAPTLTKTYSSKKVTVYFYGCCRIAMKGPLSNQRWMVETTIDLNPTPGGWINASPVSSGLPIVDVYRNVLNSWIVPAADNDGDQLSYRLASKRETTGSTSRGGNPSGMTMTATGLVQWKPTTNGLYGTQVRVSDAYSSIAVDYILRVQDSRGSQCHSGANSNPTFGSPSPWVDGSLPTCFKPGSTTTFKVLARDSADTCDTLFIQSGSVPVGASFSKSSGSNPVTYQFSWKPSSSNAGNHLVCFIARDSIGGSSKQECITLYVPSSGSVNPTISSVSPKQGETTGNTAITVKGSNFERGSGLYCRFRFSGVSTKTLVRAVYVSSGEIVCVTPSQPSGASAALALDISNLASCDDWTQAMSVSSFYYTACPPGSTLSGPTCSECPAGTYQAGGSAGGEGCTKCPAGRYGDSLGLKSPLCTDTCPKGFYCPAGTSKRDQHKCPAGSYGGTTGLSSSACSGLAAAGYYTAAGATSASQFPCSAGRWGSGGQTTSSCSGPCSAGYYCPSASSSSTASKCGAASKFCPEGSSAASTVQSGYYSVGGADATVRTSEQICDEGYYCSNGVRTQCPAGRYGDAKGLSSSACSGPCKAGFFCPAGSTSSTAEKCDPDGSGDRFCPQGTSSRKSVQSGYYTTPLTSDPSQRSGEKQCETEYVCIDGIRKRKVQWELGCRALTDLESSAGGILGGADLVSKYTVDENGQSGTIDLGLVQAISNQQGSASTVSYSVVTTRNSPSSLCTASGLLKVTSATGGGMTVQVEGPLNFERCSRLELQLRATAGSFSEDCAITVDVADKNDSPELTTSSTSRSVREDAPINGLVGGPMLDVEVSDEDAGQELTFSITSSDFGLFKIGACSGQLSLAVETALDYETRTSYPLTITIADDHPTDSKSVTLAVTVFVTDVNEAPRFNKLPQPAPGSGTDLNATVHFDFHIDENSPAGQALATDLAATATDPDTPTAASSNTLTYSIIEQDPELFAIDSATGAITVAPGVQSTPGGRIVDFESLVGGAVSLRIKVADDLGLSDEATFPVRVLDVNDPPTVPASVNSSVGELATEGTAVTDSIEALDEDKPWTGVNFSVVAERAWMRHDASWQSTGSSSSFAFKPVTAAVATPGVSAAKIALSAASSGSAVLDFERSSKVELTLRATDGPHNGDVANTRDTVVTLAVLDANEAPFFVGVKGSAAAAVADAASVPPDGTFAYKTQPTAVTSFSLSVSELAPSGMLVGGAAAFDPDVLSRQNLFVTTDTSQGAVSKAFAVDTNGNVTLVGDAAATAAAAAASAPEGVVLDFETTTSYSLPLIVRDSGSPSLSASATLTINVIDEQERPTIASDQSFSVPENSAAGTALTGGAVQASDPDAADVGGLTFEVLFDSSGSLTAALRSNTSAPLFQINPTTGQLRVSDAAYVPAGDHENSDVDHETVATSFVTVRVTDTGGNSHTEQVLVSVTDINERPSPPGTSQVMAVKEQSSTGTTVGVLDGVDVDRGDSVSFTLGDTVAPAVPGARDACSPPSSIFELVPETSGSVVAGSVRLSSSAPARPNDVSDSTEFGFGCNVSFTVQDAAGLSSSTGYVWIELVRNNQPPTYASLPKTIEVGETTIGESLLLASLEASDSNTDQTLTHSIRSVRPEAAAPSLSLESVQPGRLWLRTGFGLDYETYPTINVTVETKDDGLPTGLKTAATLFIRVLDEPEPPSMFVSSGAVGSGMSVLENSAPGTVVGSVSATDEDRGETLTFSLAPASGSADPADVPFEVDGSTGTITVRSVSTGAAADGLSHEAAASWDVTLTVTDKDGLTDSLNLTITVEDVNEPCTATVAPASPAHAVDVSLPGGAAAQAAGLSAQVSEAVQPGTVVARISATDPDDPNHPQGWGRLTYRVVPDLQGNEAAASVAPTSTPGTASLFRVSSMGEVSVAERLDFHAQEKHVVVVEVVDEDAARPLGVNVSVGIRVFDDASDVVLEAVEGAVVHPTAGGADMDFVGLSLGLQGRRMTRASAGYDLVAPTFSFVARAVGLPGPRHYNTTACAQAVAGDATRIRCKSPQGYGTGWQWTLEWSATYSDGLSFTGSAAAAPGFETRTTAPVVTSVVSGLRDEPTAGGSVLEVEGTDFGEIGTPVGVSYGQASGLEHSAANCVVSVAHTRIRCTTVAGVGTGLGVVAHVAGQSSPRFEPSSSATPLGYAVPAVTGLVVIESSSDPQSAVALFDASPATALLHTSGPGQQVVIRGTDLGADASAFSFSFGHGAGDKYHPGEGDCDVVASHTVFSCRLPPGQGKGLRVRVAVGGQMSPLAADAPFTTLSYASPVVEGVAGLGSAQGSTSGSDAVVLRGSDFPPVGDSFAPTVRYGPAPDGTLYTAQGCAVTVTGSEITCLTAEGVGASLDVWLAVEDADPLSGWSGPPSPLPSTPSFPRGVTYHPPVVTGYEGPGATGASTEGGPAWYVDVTGRNFGPVGHGAISTVTYAKPAIADGREPGIIFQAGCLVLEAHTRLRCNTSQGAGADLAWNVTIGGQLSVEPNTAYNPPTILSFGGAAAPPASEQPASGFSTATAVPDGNETIILHGRDFGPPSEPGYLEWVRFAPAAAANASAAAARSGGDSLYYSAQGCAVVSHTEIRCTTPPASGGPLFWTARIKGQTSAASPPFYVRKPRPLFLEPASFTGASADAAPVVKGPIRLTRSTEGGQRVRVVGRWFAPSDPFARVLVRWGTRTILPTRAYKVRVPRSLVLAAEAGTAGSWSAASVADGEEVETMDALELTAPEGFGTGLQVRVVVQSLAGEATSELGDLVFDFAPPSLSFPSVREDVDNPVTMMFMLLRGANLCKPPTAGYVDADGDPPAGSVSSFENCARVMVMNEDDPDPSLRTVYRTLSPSEVVSHSHSEIVVHIGRGRGSAKVEVAGRASDAIRFEQLAPGLLTGECDRFDSYTFRTLGWTQEDPSQLLTLQAFDICNATLDVTIGGLPCTEVTFPPRFVGTDGSTGKRICEISCRVPPGEGADKAVIVVNGGMASDDGGAPCTVSYALPTVTRVLSRLDARGDPLPPSSTVTVDALGRDPVTITGARVVSSAGGPPAGSFVRPGQVVATPYAGSSADRTVSLPTSGGRILLEGDSLGGIPFSDLASSTTVTMQPDGASRPASKDTPMILDAVGIGHNHTLVELDVPGSLTGTGWVLSVMVAGQPSPHYLGLRAEPPRVDAVSPLRARTAGGALLTVTGRNFGAFSSRVSVTVGGVACVGAVITVPHRALTCTAPEGAGPAAPVEVTVDAVASGTAHGVHLSYMPPSVVSVSPSTVTTDGRSVVVITGDNLGRTSPEPGSGQAMASSIPVLVSFVPIPSRVGKDLVRSVPDPNGGTPFEHGGSILYHNHTHVVLQAPQIQGDARVVRVTVAGQSTVDAASDASQGSPPEVMLGVQPPLLNSAQPLLGPTKGYLVRFKGSSLGRVEPLADASDKEENQGLVVLAVAPGGSLKLPCTSVSTAGGEWAREYAAWDFVDPLTGERPPRPSSPYTHDEYFCRLPRGFGANISLEVTLDGIPASAMSAVSHYSYSPPGVRTLVPNQPTANGRKGVFLQGENFGAATFGEAVNVVAVGLSGVECEGAELQSDERIECDTQKDVVGVKILELDAAGYVGLQFPVPTLAERGMDVWRVEAVCAVDTYGQPGELCLDCPGGGVCEGSKCVVEAPPTQAAACMQFIEPYALAGFWKIDQPSELCPADRKLRPAPFNGSCPAFLPCDPKEACLGSNQCAEGYTGERCGECWRGQYYRRNGQCIQCPDNFWLLPILFVFLVFGVALGGYTLHRLDAGVAGFGTVLFVAVDHMQVLSILARSRVQWPPFLRDVLELLSVFSLNIELVGFECAMPDLGYETRWLATELLPVAFVVIFVFFHCVMWLFKCAVMRQDKTRRNDHVSSLIATSVLLCYILYLQVTRTAFDVLNCMQLDPPDGHTYLEVVFTRCGEGLQARLAPLAYVFILLYTVGFVVFAGVVVQKNKEKVKIDQILRAMDVTTKQHGLLEFRRRWSRLYMHFVPGQAPYWILLLLVRKSMVAVAALVFGRVPSFQLAAIMLVLFIAFILNVRYAPYMSYDARKEVVLQHRAKVRAGDELHKAIALTYQRAIADRRTKRRAHAAGLDTLSSSAADATSRRARMLRAAKWSGDPNRMETILLFVSMLVALTGILMSASDADSASSAAQRDAIAYAALVLLIIAIMYAFGFVLFEIASTFVRGESGGFCGVCAGSSKSKSKSKSKDGKAGKALGSVSALKGKKGSKGLVAGQSDGQDLDSVLRTMEREAAAKLASEQSGEGESTEVGFHVNPMAAAAVGSDGTGAGLESVLSSDMSPNAAQWATVRKHADGLEAMLDKLRWEVSELKKNQQERVRARATGGAAGRQSIAGRVAGFGAAARKAMTARRGRGKLGSPLGGGAEEDTPLPVPSEAAVKEAAMEAIKAAVATDKDGAGESSGSSSATKSGVDVGRVRRLSRAVPKAAGGRKARRRGGGEKRPSIAMLAKARPSAGGGSFAAVPDTIEENEEDAFAGNATCGPWTRVHNESGEIWYVNELTNESRWEMPEGFDAPGAALWTPEMTAAAATNAAADAIVAAREDKEQAAARAIPGGAATGESGGDSDDDEETDEKERASERLLSASAGSASSSAAGTAGMKTAVSPLVHAGASSPGAK